MEEILKRESLEPEKRRPISQGWVPLGEGKGVKWTLWSNNVTLCRQEKQGDRWITTEELHAAPSLLREMAWRVSHWLVAIDQNKNKNRKAREVR